MVIGFRFPVLNARTDISYGIYIYHMTIVNALLVLYGTGGGWLRLVCVVALTCAVSWLSALTVGSYGLRRKSVMAIELK